MAEVRAEIIGQQLIEKALLDAFETWVEQDVNGEFWDTQFKTNKWNWDQPTVRKNGQIVFSPRNILDLGDLYRAGINSFKLNRNTNGIEANWNWSDAKNSTGDSYAWYVHEGTSRHPGRPFTDDISIPSTFFRKSPGVALMLRVEQSLERLNEG